MNIRRIENAVIYVPVLNPFALAVHGWLTACHVAAAYQSAFKPAVEPEPEPEHTAEIIPFPQRKRA